jgi:hypothetical protein
MTVSCGLRTLGRRQALPFSTPKCASMTRQAAARPTAPTLRTAPAAFLVAVVLLAALTAAAAAHSTIDFVGDFALAHDSYDGLAHHTRTLAFVVVLIIATVGVLRFLWSALDDAHASTGTFRALVNPVLALPAWRFAALVAILALMTVMAMESSDALLDGVRMDDFADVLGGSIPLGLAVTIAISACTGFAVSHLFRALAAAHSSIVELVCALLIRIRRRVGSPRAIRTALSLGSFVATISVLSTCAAKRAPPPFLA